jgi:spoIIIJ-associated protein
MLWTEEDSRESLAEELLKCLLEGMGINAQIEIRQREGNLILSIEGCTEAGRVIGKDGNILHQIQFLLNLMLMKKLKSRMNVVVDVEGYRERRRKKLISQAEEAARRIKRTGKPIILEPMHSADRRIVHLALKDDPLLETISIDENRETGMKSVRISLRQQPLSAPEIEEIPEIEDIEEIEEPEESSDFDEPTEIYE